MYMLYVRMREKKEEVFYDRNECEIAESCFSGVVVKKKKNDNNIDNIAKYFRL